jgi:hypothetical protein
MPVPVVASEIVLFPLSEAKFARGTVMVSDWWPMIGSHGMVLACRDLLRLLRLLRNYGSRMARAAVRNRLPVIVLDLSIYHPDF